MPNLIDELNSQVDDLVNFYGPNKAIALCQQVINQAILLLSGLHDHKGEKDKAAEVLQQGKHFATDSYIYSNLAVKFIENENFDEALKIIEYALEKFPPTAEIHYNHCIALEHLRRYEESIAAANKSLEIKPDQFHIHYKIGNVYGKMGNFKEYYKRNWYRFINPGYQGLFKIYNKPMWNGSDDIQNKTILIFNEQGNGDLIQYARYIPQLKKRGCRTILETKEDMVDLFKSCNGVDEMVLLHQPCAYDYIISINDLPAIFDPDLDNIPISDHYLQPSPIPIELERGSYKIGICWAGFMHHTDDRNRSCQLKYFKPIFRLPVSVYSLQVGDRYRSWQTGKNTRLSDGNEDLKIVDLKEGAAGYRFTDFSDSLTSYNTTANLIKQLDLVICVDTSVAHLAGAIGAPVWVLLPASFDIRWFREWYPSMKIFKQKELGNWEELFERVVNELAQKIKPA